MNLNRLNRITGLYDVPIIVRPNFNNAFYVAPGSVPERESDNPLVNEAIGLSKLPKGGVVIGEKVLNYSTIAHEMGHANDTNFLNKLAPKINYYIDKYKLPMLSTLGAAGIGYLYPDYARTAHLVNVGLNALSMLPGLHNEYTANVLGKQIEPRANQSKLTNMLLSHAKQLSLNRLAVPMLGLGINEFPIIGTGLGELIKNTVS